jgi:hypothetical protein
MKRYRRMRKGKKKKIGMEEKEETPLAAEDVSSQRLEH